MQRRALRAHVGAAQPQPASMSRATCTVAGPARAESTRSSWATSSTISVIAPRATLVGEQVGAGRRGRRWGSPARRRRRSPARPARAPRAASSRAPRRSRARPARARSAPAPAATSRPPGSACRRLGARRSAALASKASRSTTYHRGRRVGELGDARGEPGGEPVACGIAAGRAHGSRDAVLPQDRLDVVHVLGRRPRACRRLGGAGVRPVEVTAGEAAPPAAAARRSLRAVAGRVGAGSRRRRTPPPTPRRRRRRARPTGLNTSRTAQRADVGDDARRRARSVPVSRRQPAAATRPSSAQTRRRGRAGARRPAQRGPSTVNMSAMACQVVASYSPTPPAVRGPADGRLARLRGSRHALAARPRLRRGRRCRRSRACAALAAYEADPAPGATSTPWRCSRAPGCWCPSSPCSARSRSTTRGWRTTRPPTWRPC